MSIWQRVIGVVRSTPKRPSNYFSMTLEQLQIEELFWSDPAIIMQSDPIKLGMKLELIRRLIDRKQSEESTLSGPKFHH